MTVLTMAVLCSVFVHLFATPMNCTLPGSTIQRDSPGKNTEVVCHSLLQWTIFFSLVMASGPITSWQIDGDTVADFIFGSKITADGDCSYEIKKRVLLGRKVITNLDSILKRRDVTLPPNVCLVKAMVFPVVTYRC